MIGNRKKLYFSTFLYPRERKLGFHLRIILTIIVCLFVIVGSFLLIYTGVKYLGPFALIIGLLSSIFIVPIVLYFLVGDCYIRLRRTSTAYKPRAKIVITYLDVSIKIGSRIIHSMRLEDIDIIEKMYYDDEKVILFIKDIMGRKVVKCSYKLNNYILVPYRPEIENAISKFLGKKIEMAPVDINRFGRDDA